MFFNSFLIMSYFLRSVAIFLSVSFYKMDAHLFSPFFGVGPVICEH